MRLDPTFAKGALDNLHLDIFDGHGIVVEGKDAGIFTGRRTEGSRELGEVVGLLQTAPRPLPVLLVDKLVPVGYEVAKRAAGMTEGHTAAHASLGLASNRGRIGGRMNVPIVHEP